MKFLFTTRTLPLPLSFGLSKHSFTSNVSKICSPVLCESFISLIDQFQWFHRKRARSGDSNKQDHEPIASGSNAPPSPRPPKYAFNCIVFSVSLKIVSDQKRNARSEFHIYHSVLLTNRYYRELLCVKCGHALSSKCKEQFHSACANRSQLCHFTDPVSQFTAYRNSDGYLPCPRCKRGFVHPSELTVCILVDFSSYIVLI
jgi:hypothetical protein